MLENWQLELMKLRQHVQRVGPIAVPALAVVAVSVGFVQPDYVLLTDDGGGACSCWNCEPYRGTTC